MANNVDAIIRRLQSRVDARLTGSRAELEAWGERAQDHMRRTAPWQDRPDDQRPEGLPHARELLHCAAMHPPALQDGGAVGLVQGATYGWALELAFGSAFAIVQPTVAIQGPDLMPRLGRVWK